MILSLASDIVKGMELLCSCAACLDDLTTPPTDYIDPREAAYEMAMDACWQDMADNSQEP